MFDSFQVFQSLVIVFQFPVLYFTADLPGSLSFWIVSFAFDTSAIARASTSSVLAEPDIGLINARF